MNIYEIREACVVFREGKRETEVFRDLSLDVEEGSFLVLMGPSGSGKTSVINVLAGFLPLTSGTARFDGADLYGMTEAAISRYRSRDIGMVHQFFNLIPEFTARQNVMAPLLVNGLSYKEAGVRAEGLLEHVGLGHRVRHRPSELSGGEQQRVAIARAVANRPRVLLCDEPTGNLDAKNSRSVLALLAELQSESSCTVVMVTHDPEAARVGTRVVEMRSA